MTRKSYCGAMLLPVLLLPGFLGCQAETREVKNAVHDVKNSVEGIQTKMDAHNQKLEDLMSQDK